MTQAATRFWTEENDYHDLARYFEEHIELKHPDRAKGECSHICGRCCWAATTVTYPTYSGSRINSLS